MTIKNPFAQLDAVPGDVDPALANMLRQWHAALTRSLASVNPAGADQVGIHRDSGLYIKPSEMATALAGTFQPLDSDLTAIAALTTTTFGRSLLTQASALAARAALGAVGTSISWFVTFGSRPNNSTAGTIGAADGSISDATDMDGHVIGRNMADGARTDLSFMFVVPNDLDVTAAITARAYYRLAAAGTSRNVEIETTSRVSGDGDVTVSGGTQFDTANAKSVNAYASGALVVHNLGTIYGASTLANRSIVHGTVFRNAQPANTDDDFANTINFLALEFIGTRVTT